MVIGLVRDAVTVGGFFVGCFFNVVFLWLFGGLFVFLSFVLRLMLREAFDESNRDQAMTFEMIEPVVEVESAISSEATGGGLCSSR